MRRKIISVLLACCMILAILPVKVFAAEPTIYYVKSDGAGDGTGDWGNASKDLAAIMNAAKSGDQVWVAKGTYSPGTNQTDTFNLKKGVKVYGGFEGIENNLSERDWVKNVTVLDGNDNVYHVVTGQTGGNSQTRLDGFTITRGNANGEGDKINKRGGGMYNEKSDLTVANCTFLNNTAIFEGGGMLNYFSDAVVENCIFYGNKTTGVNSSGGGMFNLSSDAIVENCTFSGNTTSTGGGMCNHKSKAKVVNCTFSGNKTSYGAGIYNEYHNPVLMNCTFSGNTATISGGGMENSHGSSPKLVNTIIWGNTAPDGMEPDIYQHGSTLTLDHCVVGTYNTEDGVTMVVPVELIVNDPNLIPLDKDGNPVANLKDVYVYKLGDDSLAIDAGMAVGDTEYNVAVPDTDQLGTVRPQSSGVDIGAYEAVAVAVVSVKGVTLDKATMNLTAGGAKGTLTATVAPADATDKDVTWKSDNDAVATVANGVVTPKAAGKATITVTTVDGSHTDTCDVIVVADDSDDDTSDDYVVVIVIPAPKPTIPATKGKTDVDYKESDGLVTLVMPKEKIDEVIRKNTDNLVDFDISGIENATTAKMSKEAFNALSEAGMAVTVKLPDGSITLDKEAVKSVTEQAEGDSISIEISIIETEQLNHLQEQSVNEDDIVVDINVVDGKGNIIRSFDGELTVLINYNGPLPVTVWYLNNIGQLERIDAAYKDGIVTFKLNHLSVYILGHEDRTEEWDNPFTDVNEGDMYYDEIKYVHMNKLMYGADYKQFVPHGYMPRGLFMVVIHRLEKCPDPKGYDAFNDVAANKYYSKAVNWAAENNIVSGYGDGEFAPNAPITMEQLVLILMNYAKYKGYDTSVRGDLETYADVNSISDWAKEAMDWANGEAIYVSDETNLNPKGYAKRCHVAVMLKRFIENVK